MEFKDELILIDGNSLMNRAFYALPMLKTQDGTPSGAVYGFANMLVKMIDDYCPKYIAVAFDVHAPTFRHLAYDGYKATRKGMPEELVAQMPIVKEMLDKMGITYVEREGFEADDVIGSLAKQSKVKTYILTGDRDAFQLIDDKITVLFTKRGISEVEVMTAENLMKTMGLTPSQIIDYKSLAGDSSDNIPGVTGIGDKRALDLLAEYGTAQNVMAHAHEIAGKLGEKLVNGKADCEKSYFLATIKTDCDFGVTEKDFTYDFPFASEVRTFFEKMEFKGLTRRLIFEGKQPEQTPEVKADVKAKSAKTVSELLDYIGNADKFSFDFSERGVKIALTCDEQLTIGARQTLLDDCPDLTEILRGLKPLLENDKIIKYVYDAKSVMHALARFGVTLTNYRDVALAEYLVSDLSKVLPLGAYAEALSSSSELTAAAIATGSERAFSALDERGMTDLYYEVELPLVKVLYDMECEGFSVDTVALTELGKQFTEEGRKCAERVYALAGEKFNVNSPKQLGEVLFDHMGLPYPKNAGKTARGEYSTSAEVLAHLSGAYPIIDEVVRYRFISKINSTYIEGLGKVAGADGVVHTDFNQMQTTTGRLSSSEPNLQNIPVRDDDGKVLRSLFKARDGHRLVAADYSQIELRVMAHLSGDENLIKAYASGEDVHTAVARELFSTDAPTDKERRKAKTVNFGIIYGMSAYGLSERLGLSPKEAREYIDKYFERYPAVKSYLDGVVAEARGKGYVQSLLGRRRYFPELQSKSYQIRSFGERAAMNMPLQASAADIIKIAMLKVSRALEGKKSKLILQVHDELIVDAPEDEVEDVIRLLTEEMEHAVTLKVPLTVSAKSGKNWLECK